ncbi:hypothetical protein B9M83_09190, partial [Mycobacteroides abscessus]
GLSNWNIFGDSHNVIVTDDISFSDWASTCTTAIQCRSWVRIQEKSRMDSVCGLPQRMQQRLYCAEGISQSHEVSMKRLLRRHFSQ